MSAFKAIVFDYYGTLFDTRSAIVHCLQRVFEISGLPMPQREAIVRTVRTGVSLRDTFLLLDKGLARDPPALHERIKTYRALYLDEGTALVAPFAGVKEVLERLHGSGIKCLVVSNKGAAAIHGSLAENGLSPLVDLVLADAPGIPRKPDPSLVTDHILPKYPQLLTPQILMVGDTETDIRFARASGMACCWASYGYGEAESCRALEPEHEISAIGELLTQVLAGQTGNHRIGKI